MKKHKSRSLALLLAVAMVFQFCIFSSQSAWAGAAEVSAAAQTQDVQVTQAQEDADQPAEEQTSDVDAPTEEEPAEEVSPGDEGGAPAEEPAAIDEETPAEEPADVDMPAEEEPAQPAAPEQKEDPADKDMPARVLTGYANGVNVFVTAEEGTFDKDVEMVVKKVTSDEVQKAAEKVIDEEIGTIKAVDITFVDKDGKEVQPAKPVKVDLRTSTSKTTAKRKSSRMLILAAGKRSSMRNTSLFTLSSRPSFRD